MKRRKKNSAKKLRDEESAKTQARRHHLKSHFKIGLLVLAVFSLIKLWLGHSAIGEHLKADAHLWLQSFLRAEGTNLPVAIIDISDLPPSPYEVSTAANNTKSNFNVAFTPRLRLAEALGRLGTARPAGIGLDIDLSIEPTLQLGAQLERESQALFDRAAELTRAGIPVFLGLKRNEALPTNSWFTRAESSFLAAGLGRSKGTVRRMPLRFDFPGHNLESLSKRLADAAQGTALFSPPALLKLLAQPISIEAPIEDLPEFKLHQFYVNYAPLDRLLKTRTSLDEVFTLSADALSKRFKGRLLLVGDGTPGKASDPAVIPGRAEPLPGVYVQACATYTLAKGPLWEVQWWAGLGMALLLSLAGMQVIQMACHRYAVRGEVSGVPLTILSTVVLNIALLAGSWLLAKLTHVLWLEVFVVCLVLVLHCLAEVLIATINWHRIGKSPRHLGEALVVSSVHRPHDPHPKTYE